MSAASNFDSLHLASAATGVTTGPRLSSDGFTANSLIGASDFRNNQPFLVEEGHFDFPVSWHGRISWRKKGHHLSMVLSAFASFATAVAVAFLALLCFKAIGKTSSTPSSLRRLSNNSGLQEDVQCTLARQEQRSVLERMMGVTWDGR
ncbi:hypothetical protein Efla_006873 [Eimeria flavescens]